MNKIWQLDIDTAIEWYELLKKLQEDLKKELTQEEAELAFLAFMKHKNIKSIGATELNKMEFLKEVLSKGKSILNIDEKGYTFIKKKDKK